jgi:PAS domain S-box-containing protein
MGQREGQRGVEQQQGGMEERRWIDGTTKGREDPAGGSTSGTAPDDPQAAESMRLRWVGGVAAVIGAVALVAWAVTRTVDGTVPPSLPVLKAGNALGFLLTGGAMWLHAGGAPPASPFRRLAFAASAGAAVLGAMTLLDLFFGAGFSPDLLFADARLPEARLLQGRMSVNGAVCLLLVSAGVWLQGRGARFPGVAFAWLGAFTVATAAAALAARLAVGSPGHPWLHGITLEPAAALLYLLQGTSFVWVASKRAAFRWALGRPRTLEFSGGLLLLFVAAVLAYRSATRFGAASVESSRSLAVLTQIADLRVAVAELETAARNAHWKGGPDSDSLFGGQNVLGPPELGVRFRRLGETLATVPAQMERLSRLRDALALWVASERDAFALRDARGPEAARLFLATPEAREQRAGVRTHLSEMHAWERLQLTQCEKRLHAELERTIALLPSGALLGMLVLSYGMVRLSLEMNARERIAKALTLAEARQRLTVEAAGIGDWEINPATHTAAHSLLHDQIFGYSQAIPQWSYERFLEHLHPGDRARIDGLFQQSFKQGGEWAAECRILKKDGSTGWIWLRGKCFKNEAGRVESVRGVIGDITERRAAEDQIHSLNASLEQRVRERTEKLELAVNELDAFTYSVSHDLRAPLRAIDGFSRMVSEDCAALLPAEALRRLGVVRSEARRMSRLIDDLLTFSRMGRAQSHPEPINMEALVRETFHELVEIGGETRKIRFTVQQLPPATGTRPMVKQLWINLLSNALKFTRGREEAVVEVGSHADPDGQTVYFIRDNGVGFDMRHAGKLFGVFQRLHSEQEFEGTGAGLALVHRIVTRHGGRVWAEAEKDKGAAFFFTLPAPTEPYDNLSGNSSGRG